MKKIRKKRIVDVKSMFLMRAVIKNNIKLLKFAVKMGADINKKVYGYTPIECAAVLLKSGADVNVMDEENMSPLAIACINGNYEVADLLIKYNADVNCQDGEGRTPLFYAKVKQLKKIQQLLLVNGADDRKRL